MAKGYLSNRQKNLRLGIVSYTEGNTVLEVTGKVGINTTSASTSLDVNGGVRVRGSFYDGLNNPGTLGQVLTSTAAGTQWNDAAPSNAITGLTIYDEGIIVGSANSVSQLNFVGAGISAAVTGALATITVSSSGAKVSVGTEAPTGPSQGDMWWDSDVGELYVYYEDGNSNQWVETSGGSETVTISDTAPPSPNYGDLWWDSVNGLLLIYYNDGTGAQWIDATGAYSSGLLYWTANSTGIHTLGNVGIGTTTARYKLEVGAVGASGTSLWVNGDARITGILSVGQGTVTIDGINNQIKVEIGRAHV